MRLSEGVELRINVVEWMRSVGKFDHVRDSEREWIQSTCVFHDDRHPSFAVNSETGVFKCQACGASGNFVALVKHVEGHDTAYDAEQSLIARFARYVPATDEALQLDFGDREEETFVSNAPAFYSEYLAERGISASTQATFEAGRRYHDDGTVRLPWHYTTGKVVTVKVRSTTDKRFWYDPPVSPGRLKRLLYGFHLARSAKRLVVVEAEICTMTITQAGDAAVGLGTSDVSNAQLALLRNHPCEEVVIWVDNPFVDTIVKVGGKRMPASAKAREKLVDGLVGHKRVSVVDYSLYPTLKDPNDVLREHGEDGVRRTIEQRIPVGLSLKLD